MEGMGARLEDRGGLSLQWSRVAIRKMQEAGQNCLFSKMGSILTIFIYGTNSGPTRPELKTIQHVAAQPAENGN